jgi:hypothetical protein
MKLQAVVITMAAMYLGAELRGANPVSEPAVRVPVFVDNHQENPVVFVQAQKLASRMFAAASVEIDWRANSRQDAPGLIVLTIVSSGESKLSSGALAGAQPYEGTHIQVVYDRVKSAPRSVQPYLLAHVLVHEITHILQGTARHSTTGVMKATWNTPDFQEMLNRPLPFTSNDIELIQLGLKSRSARTAVGSLASMH